MCKQDRILEDELRREQEQFEHVRKDKVMHEEIAASIARIEKLLKKMIQDDGNATP